MTRVKRCQVGLVGMPSPSTWVEHDTQIHTVTSGSAGSPDTGQIFDSNILNPGATFTQFFVQYGTFPYHCTLHPQMVGTVVVV